MTKILKSASIPSFHIPHTVSCPLLLPLLPSFTSVFTLHTQQLLFSHHVRCSSTIFGSFPSVLHLPSSPGDTDPHRFNTDSSISRFTLPLLFPIMSSEAVTSKEERTGSITASHGRRGWTSSICIYIASSWAEKEGGEDEELGRGGRFSVQKCLLISILHIHECPVDNEREDGGDRGSVSDVSPALLQQ